VRMRVVYGVGAREIRQVGRDKVRRLRVYLKIKLTIKRAGQGLQPLVCCNMERLFFGDPSGPPA